MKRGLSLALLGSASSALLGWLSPVQAQSAADFYKGNTVHVMIGYPPGGGYDLRARLLARYIGKHIPGHPTVTPQNYPGAAGLRLANHLAKGAPTDGTTFGMLARNAPTAPLLIKEGVQFDARQLTWIGSISDSASVCMSWHTSNVMSFDNLLSMPFAAGAIGTASDSVMFTKMIRNTFDAKKIKIVTGYPGSSALALAMEKGEIDGICGFAFANLVSSYPHWLAEKKVNILMQLSTRKADDVGNVPLVTDLARNAKERQIFELMFSRQQMAYPLAAPPDLPSDRTATLRAGFDATMKDSDFLAEAKKLKVEVSPTSGSDMQKAVAELYKTPADVIKAAVAAVTD